MRLIVIGVVFILATGTLVTLGILTGGIRRIEVQVLLAADSIDEKISVMEKTIQDLKANGGSEKEISKLTSRLKESRGRVIDPEEVIQVDDGEIVDIQATRPNLRFLYATKKEPGRTIQVECDRFPPENFRVGIPASIKGTYDRETGVFKALSVTTQCPSRYSPKEEMENYDQKRKIENKLSPLKPSAEGTSMKEHGDKNQIAVSASAR